MHGGGGGFHGGVGGFRGGVGGFRSGIGGFRGGIGFRGSLGFRGNRFFGFYSPFYYPWFYGGYGYYPFYDYPYYDSSYLSYPSYPYADTYSSGAPAVIINQNSGYPAAPPPPPAPVVREYTGPPSQAQQNETPLYLLAFQDGIIRAVLAYWIDGTTLHFVSLEHEEKTAPLASVDKSLSERLNRERNVTFQLPH